MSHLDQCTRDVRFRIATLEQPHSNKTVARSMRLAGTSMLYILYRQRTRENQGTQLYRLIVYNFNLHTRKQENCGSGGPKVN